MEDCTMALAGFMRIQRETREWLAVTVVVMLGGEVYLSVYKILVWLVVYI